MKRNKRVRPGIVTPPADQWLVSGDETNGHGRKGDARFDE